MRPGTGVADINAHRIALPDPEDRTRDRGLLARMGKRVHRHDPAVDQFDIDVDDLQIEIRIVASRDVGRIGCRLRGQQ